MQLPNPSVDAMNDCLHAR